MRATRTHFKTLAYCEFVWRTANRRFEKLKIAPLFLTFLSGFSPRHVNSFEMGSNKTPRGFIALLSTIVISFTLLIAVIIIGDRGVVGRYQLLDLENKQASQALAESCIGSAMIGIANDPTFSVSNVSVPVGSYTCTVISVSPNTPTSGNTTLKASGVKSGATTYLKVVVNSSSVAVTNWQETANP